MDTLCSTVLLLVSQVLLTTENLSGCVYCHMLDAWEHTGHKENMVHNHIVDSFGLVE